MAAIFQAEETCPLATEMKGKTQTMFKAMASMRNQGIGVWTMLVKNKTERAPKSSPKLECKACQLERDTIGRDDLLGTSDHNLRPAKKRGEDTVRTSPQRTLLYKH